MKIGFSKEPLNSYIYFCEEFILQKRCFNMRFFQLIIAFFLISLSMHSTSYADITPVSDRTSQVRDVIITAAGVNTASEVTDTHLAAITRLNLRNTGITELQSGDFSGMTGLTSLNLYGNELSSLPDGIFEGLTALTSLRLGGNTVNPMPITVTLEKVADGQFKAVAPTGAPFDMVLPISATNGSIADNTSSLTISKGSTASGTLTVTRTAGTTAAANVNIGTLPSLPANHYGYSLSKSSDLPVEIIAAVITTEEAETTPTPPSTEENNNVAPIFTDGATTIRSVAENTAAATNIGTAVSATDNDSLTYTLSGTDAASFDIDSTTGQLKTKGELDYETKRVYSVTITVSDGTLTDMITVIINIIDVSDTTIVSTSIGVSDRTPAVRDAIVAAVPNVSDAADVTDTHLAAITELNLRNSGITSLQSGDLGGLTGLTNLNLYGNMLSSLPSSIFEGLTALTALRLGGNLVDPMPLIVSIQQVSAGQFRAVIAEGAPFDVSIPVSGSTVTISKGSTESTTFTSTTNVSIGTLPSLPTNHFGYVLAKSAICSRTSQVAEAIAAAVPNVTDCNNVTEADMAQITSLNLSSKSITSLASDDFVGLLSLTTLDLSNNQLSSLPNGIFDGLTNLTSVDLSGNTIDPISLSVSLVKVSMNQVKAVVPTGAPYNITLPISVANGSLSGGTTLTIATGSVESSMQTITRTSGTTAAVTVDIDTLPSLPTLHSGYALTKSSNLPLEIFKPINVAPVFTDGATTTRSIAENTAAGTNIGNAVAATDANSDTLTYSLSGTDAESFAIVSTTGQLKTKTALDYETKTSYAVTITVSDGSLTDSINVTINITDIDENRAPVFADGDSTTRSVVENTGTGVNIGTAVSATDADEDTLSYTLSGTDASSFSIDSSNGQLRTKSDLDYETKTVYSVTITVSDGSLTDSISVTINVTDVDETSTTTTKDTSPPNNVPMFSEGDSTTRSVAENTGSGVDIGAAVSATDADEDTLVYSLDGTDASSFSIDSSSGQLKTSASLDYETKDSYSVTITVSDGNGGSDSITVTINVTDVDESVPNNAPAFVDGDSTTRSIAENTGSGVDIGAAVSATDADEDTLVYSLDGTDASSFSIDSSSGQLKTSASLDYETKDSYSVTITVSDGNGGSDSITVTINVTDVDESVPNNAPAFVDGDSTTRSIAENTGSGVDIGAAVSATDADEDTLVYSLDGTDASSFSIDSSSGQLRTSASLDYESKTSYSVTVSVSDGKGGSDSISVTINITNLDETVPNNAPVFSSDSTTRSIAENSATDTNIGGVITATDSDNDTLTYTLSGTNSSDFSIVSTSGQLKTKSALNHELKSSYSVTITASDGKGGSDSISVTISVTDVNEAPVFTDGTTTTRAIAENVGENINIGKVVSASDPDDGAKLEYTLDGTNAESFNIDSTTGQLKTKAALDFETKPSYSVIVKVSDGNLTDSIAVTINITNLDETPSNIAPVFNEGESTSRSVAENTVADENIGSAVSATDEDSNTLAYLLSGDDASSFSIDGSTGQLKTSAALDHEDEDTYEVTVTVNDGSSTDTIDVTINVTDVNEAPVFSDDSKTLSVAENTAADTNIGSAVSATDPEGDDLTYSLEGADAGSFDVVDSTGQLKTKAALDYESDTSYSVTLKASDDKLSDTISIIINVTNVDENRAPEFASESTTRSVAENTGSGVDIGDAVSATDADEDTLTYTLGGTDAASFDIGSTNGQLRTKAALDYETKRSYSVTVTASDSKKTDTINVTINVMDVNENRAPSFGSASTTRSVTENTTSGTNIGDAVSATDADEDTLTYTLGGTDASSFSIVSTSGQLQTSAALDYEDKTSYSVTVTATDDSGASNDSTSINVTISVTDVDENRAPTFSNSNISFNFSDIASASVGDSIGKPITASDLDADTLEYSVGGDDASKFSIDSTSAQLKVTQALIDDTSSSYSIKVIATDPDNATAEISVTIYVTRLAIQQQQQRTIKQQQQSTNSSPAFDDGSSTTRAIAEGTASGQNIGSPISATDADTDDTLTYSLVGTDAASFSIVSTSGQLQTSAALDYETKNSYSVTVKVTDDSGESNNSDTISVTISITDVNDVPVFTDGASTTRSIAENTASGQNIGSPVSATDADTGDTLTYTLGGTDASSFSIVSTSGQLQTSAALDYETKRSYSVTVTATDDSGASNNSASITVTISVTDMDENTITPVSERSNGVQRAIVRAIDGIDSAANVTKEHLAGITHLNVSSFDPLKNGDFDGLTALTTLWLDGNDLTSLPTDIFDGLTALTTLELNDNSLASLPSGVFDDLTSLTTLQLYFNDLTSLPSGIFDNNTSLATLDLGGNDLALLPSGIFDKLTALTFLDLGDNDLTSLPSDIFDELTALTYLDLFLPDLTSLPSDIFDELTSLTTFFFNSGVLTSLPSDIFDELTSLTRISFNGSALTSLPSDIFDELTSLTRLSLLFPNLTSLPSDVFDELTSLTTLKLRISGLTSLPSDVFDGPTALIALDLSGNGLTSLPSDVFDGLTALIALDLSGNGLTSLPSDVFDGLTALIALDLSGNGLTSLPSDVFDEPTALTIIRLSGNNLSSLPSGIFDGLTALTILQLSGNTVDPLPLTVSLKKISEGEFKAVAPTGAPFSILLQISVSNGTIGDEVTRRSLRIPTGSTESETLTVQRIAGTSAAVTVDIGTLPFIPTQVSIKRGGHNGYELNKSDDLPLEVIGAIGEAPTPLNTLTSQIPERTELLINYPNPFNPETWIPYHLANPADVLISIYNMQGVVVRRLELGHQLAGYYTSRSRAAYWDGTNNHGERVGSGVYFYQLQVGEMSYLRKMVILK